MMIIGNTDHTMLVIDAVVVEVTFVVKVGWGESSDQAFLGSSL